MTRLSLITGVICGLVALSSVAEAQNCKHARAQMPTEVTISAPATMEKDIVDTAVAAGKFKTLATAVQAAGLIDTLKGKGPFTVFAPTDEAFAKLPEGTVATLVKPENKKKLQDILKYHVASGSLEAKDVIRLRLLETVLGKDVKIGVTDAGVTINGAKVVTTDIKCSNGVIHVIDSVILPE